LNRVTLGFERKCTKYWVRPEDVELLRAKIHEHLPSTFFGSSSINKVTSVYFDNPQFRVYYERKSREDGAKIFRIRYYGEELREKAFAELKRHRHGKRMSIKSRQEISVTDIPVLMWCPKLWDAAFAQKYVKFNDKKDAKFVEFKDTVQRFVKSYRVRPNIRTVCYREHFERSDIPNVRFTLDTDLTMARVLNKKDAKKHRVPVWEHEADPFLARALPKYIKKTNVASPFLSDFRYSKDYHFPCAVLELKLMGEWAGNAALLPPWVQDILAMCVKLHRYSKYVHGCAMLFEKQILKAGHQLPLWLAPLERLNLGLLGLDDNLAHATRRAPFVLILDKATAQAFDRNTDHARNPGASKVEEVEDGEEADKYADDDDGGESGLVPAHHPPGRGMVKSLTSTTLTQDALDDKKLESNVELALTPRYLQKEKAKELNRAKKKTDSVPSSSDSLAGRKKVRRRELFVPGQLNGMGPTDILGVPAEDLAVHVARLQKFVSDARAMQEDTADRHGTTTRR
jgi:VTC domain